MSHGVKIDRFDQIMFQRASILSNHQCTVLLDVSLDDFRSFSKVWFQISE